MRSLPARRGELGVDCPWKQNLLAKELPMPLNHYVTLGASGLRVSPLCLGAMTFGEDLGWGSSVKDSQAILDAFLDRGGNFIDTANAYTRGHSEKIIGDHLGRHPAKRDRVVIATKFLTNLFAGDPNGGGAGRKAVIGACEESLRRLQTDYIDLYWMHFWDRHTPIEETMRAMDDLVRAGKVRYLGFSDTPAWKVTQAQMLAELRDFSPLIALQLEYSLAERTVEGELIPMAQEMGLGVTPWGPLKAGVLSGRYTRQNAGQLNATRGAMTEGSLNEKNYAIIDVLISVAKELDTAPARVALSWLQGCAGVSSLIIGARTAEQLADNVSSLDVHLSADQRKRLDDVSEPQLPFPINFLKRATNFMHGSLTVNGVTGQAAPNTPRNDSERY
jgi:aryl-alcohol dehydrogenase-like predicted oxidoreductase